MICCQGSNVYKLGFHFKKKMRSKAIWVADVSYLCIYIQVLNHWSGVYFDQ